jgi:hypothetical protein
MTDDFQKVRGNQNRNSKCAFSKAAEKVQEILQNSKKFKKIKRNKKKKKSIERRKKKKGSWN